MSVDNRFGVYNRRGELLAVEDTPEAAKAASDNMEVDLVHPTNSVFPVTVIQGTFESVIEAAVHETIASLCRIGKITMVPPKS